MEELRRVYSQVKEYNFQVLSFQDFVRVALDKSLTIRKCLRLLSNIYPNGTSFSMLNMHLTNFTPVVSL